MGIRVRHSPPIANVGNMAVDIGKGQRRDIQTQQDAQRRSQDLQERQMMLQAASAQANRQTQVQMQESGQQNQKEMAVLQEEQLQGRMAFQDELTKGRIQFEYTEQQKREMEKYAQGIAQVQSKVAAGEWRPDQGQDAVRQLEAKLMGIQPVPKYNDEETAKDVIARSTWIDDESGDKMYLNPSNGRVENLSKDKRDAEAKKRQSLNDTYIDLVKAMTSEDHGVPSHEDVLDRLYLLNPDMAPPEYKLERLYAEMGISGPLDAQSLKEFIDRAVEMGIDPNQAATYLVRGAKKTTKPADGVDAVAQQFGF